jgi:hypothetical protein
MDPGVSVVLFTMHRCTPKKVTLSRYKNVSLHSAHVEIKLFTSKKTHCVRVFRNFSPCSVFIIRMKKQGTDTLFANMITTQVISLCVIFLFTNITQFFHLFFVRVDFFLRDSMCGLLFECDWIILTGKYEHIYICIFVFYFLFELSFLFTR